MCEANHGNDFVVRLIGNGSLDFPNSHFVILKNKRGWNYEIYSSWRYDYPEENTG